MNEDTENLLELAKEQKEALEISKSFIAWDVETVKFLSVAILVFGLLYLLISGFLLYKGEVRDSMGILKALAIPIIIFLAVFLMIVGYGEQQIAPVIGLMGTVAGYLLGKESDKK